MEAAIFAYLGFFLFGSRDRWRFGLSALSIFSCISSRGIMIFLFSICSNWIASKKLRKIFRVKEVSVDNNVSVVDKRMQVMLWFAGLRGAMSFALVENIPLYDPKTGYGSRFKPELKAMTSASVAFSVFVLGGTTYHVLGLL